MARDLSGRREGHPRPRDKCVGASVASARTLPPLPAFTCEPLATLPFLLTGSSYYWPSKLVRGHSLEGATDLSPQPWPHEVCVPLAISPLGGRVPSAS